MGNLSPPISDGFLEAKHDPAMMLELETLISEFSSTLINLPIEDFKPEIDAWLERFVTFLDIDRAAIYEFTPDQQHFVLIHAYTTPNPSIPLLPQIADFGPYAEMVKAWVINHDKVFMLERIPEAMLNQVPLIGMVKDGTKAFVSVPLASRQAILGILVFSVFRHARPWPDDLVRRLKLIGEIVANALLRRRYQLELLAEIDRRGRIESRYATILKTTNVGFWMTDLNHTILEVNDAYCRMSGYSREELLAIKIDEIDAGLSTDDLERELKIAIRHGFNRHEVRHRCKDGTLMDLDISSTILSNEGVVFTFLIDITETKRADLEKQERLRFEELIADFSAALINIDSMAMEETLRIWIQTISQFLRVDRCTVTEFLDNYSKRRHIQTYTHPDFLQMALDGKLESTSFGISKIVLRGEIIKMNHIPEDIPNDLETDFTDKIVRDGTKSLLAIPLKAGNTIFGGILFCSFTIENMWSDDIVRRLGIVAQIVSNALMRFKTEQAKKNAERTLMMSEFRFRTFYHSNPEGIVLLDFDGKFIGINKAFAIMSGHTEEEVLNRHYTDFIPESYHAKIGASFSSIQAGISQNDPVEFAHIKKDGTIAPISARGWLITDEMSTPVSLGVFIRDLTKEKRLAEERAVLEKKLLQTQKMEAIGTLAGGIAHDFNNILSGIIGFTELALMDKICDWEIKRTYLSRVLEAGNRAKGLVQQILKFSRADGSNMGDIAATPLLNESIHLLRSTLPTTIRIECKCEARLDSITGDATQIHQVIMNLCTNAYHAMRDSGGVLTLSLENVTLWAPKEFIDLKVPPGEYLKLSVMDTGHGIDTVTLERIFEPYFTTKKVNEGTGLGLWVTLGIIRAHNGFIEIESIVGQGTRFNVYFPLKQAGVAQKELADLDLPKGNGQRVLIVDDEIVLLDIVQTNLELLGYRVRTQQKSICALALFKEAPHEYDLVITDQTMPEMTGIQLIAEIRKISQKIPIILMTGFSEALSGHSPKQLGITKFMMKPVTIRDLARAVHECLATDGILNNRKRRC